MMEREGIIRELGNLEMRKWESVIETSPLHILRSRGLPFKGGM